MIGLAILCLALATSLSDLPQSDAAVDAAVKPDPVESIRTARPWLVAFELGNSGLAGWGLNVGYNVTPHWSVDGGFGISVFGLKAGVRGRYNLVDARLTPFVGLGAMVGTVPWADRGTREVVPLAQGVVGLFWIAKNGFTLLSTAGWMQRLDGVNGHYPIPITWTGSDVVCSLATGYAF